MNEIALQNRFAQRWGIQPGEVKKVLIATAFRAGGSEPTDAQATALMIVADQYGLNPFVKEIYAFPDKNNGIVPIVGLDGWNRISNERPEYDGIEFRFSENMVTCSNGKPCPEWCEAIVYRKDRARPTVIREYLDEVFREPIKVFKKDEKGRRTSDFYLVDTPWQTHPKRMLRHKAMIQGLRVAFSFSGIYDEDEAERIIEGRSEEVQAKPTVAQPQAKSERAKEPEVVDAEFTDKAEQTAEVKEQAKPASTLTESMRRVLDSKLNSAGLTFEALVSGFGEVTAGNINQAFKWISQAKKGAES